MKQRIILSTIYLILLSYYYYAPIQETPLGKDFSVQHFLSSTLLSILTFEIHPITPFLISSLLEFNQIFLPYRTFDILDLLTNLLGASLGSALWIFIRRSG